MIRHTGGCAFGTISTKSSESTEALFFASSIETTPTFSPSLSMSLTLGTDISSLIRFFFGFAMLLILYMMRYIINVTTLLANPALHFLVQFSASIHQQSLFQGLLRYVCELQQSLFQLHDHQLLANTEYVEACVHGF